MYSNLCPSDGLSEWELNSCLANLMLFISNGTFLSSYRIVLAIPSRKMLNSNDYEEPLPSSDFIVLWKKCYLTDMCVCTSYRYKFLFPNSLHQGFNVIFDLKFAYKRVLMFLSDWWVSFSLLLFLSNLFNCS